MNFKEAGTLTWPSLKPLMIAAIARMVSRKHHLENLWFFTFWLRWNKDKNKKQLRTIVPIMFAWEPWKKRLFLVWKRSLLLRVEAFVIFMNTKLLAHLILPHKPYQEIWRSKDLNWRCLIKKWIFRVYFHSETIFDWFSTPVNSF